MVAESLSYAQSLRVIGQDLDKFRLNSFRLEKKGDEYVVQIDPTDSPRQSLPREGFLARFIEKIMGSERALEATPKLVRFTSTGILWSDTERKLKRYEPDGMPMHNLSVVLRALGNYLDRKGASDFAISWTTHSAKVSYNNKEEYFSTDNLHDLGISMYLKRVTRH